MHQKKNMFVAIGSVSLLLAVTLPLKPQAMRKRGPVTAEPPVTTKRPTDSVVAPPPREERESRTFEKPRYLDDRLDWCLGWGYNCGRPAAVAFCHRRRFEDATGFEAEVVGRSAQTRLMGNDQVCNADFCTAFAYITCSGPIDTNRVFANPSWQEFRLDVCLLPGGYCGGKQAADRFCANNGFSDSLDSTPDHETGNQATRSIGNGAICEKGCKGFQQIICR